jgi:PBSX family phage portal protein
MGETPNSAAEPQVDFDKAVRELADRVPLVKAHLIGRERVAESNAMPWTDVDQREQVFAGMGVVTPPYDPETLAILFENSSSLRQNVDSYVTNIDAFGHRFEPVIDLDASDADQHIANAIYVERVRLKEDPRHRDDPKVKDLPLVPTPDDVAVRKQEVTEHMRIERTRLETFFDFCCVDLSFVTLRRRTRQDIEVMGNGYWEILRNGVAEIVQFVYIPGFTMRLLPLDPDFVEVDAKVKVSELTFDTMKVRRRFRRYVQVFEQQIVFFKEFGDPRVLSRKHGTFHDSVEEIIAKDASDGPATEILHFKLHNPRSAYGTPRWIGNLLAVLGTRQAEEVNFLFFENKSVPPLAILVSGGRLSAQSVPRIESYIETHIKGKRNFHKILILEAEPVGSGGGLEHTGRLKVEIKPLTGAQQQDALFMGYDERNADKVGQSFRLPRLLRGDIRDFNRSCYSADTETLTENGWKRHHEIAPDERIAVYDAKREELRFEVPAFKHVASVREKLFHFAGKHTDILVTGDHTMLVRCPGRSWIVETASRTARRSRFEVMCAPESDVAGVELRELTLPKVCEIERGHRHRPIPGDLWVEFLGYFMSDGGLLETNHETAPYLVFLRQKKVLYLGRMERCLRSIGWKFSTQVKQDGTHVLCISNRCLRDWLAIHCGGRSAERHLPWEYVTGLPVRQLEILFRAMMDDDGTRAMDLRSGAYHSASGILSDQAQAILSTGKKSEGLVRGSERVS